MMLKCKDMTVQVKNITEGKEKYVVARLVSGELWYYGRYDTEQRAKEVAEEFENGIVLFDTTAKDPKPEVKCPTCGRILTDFDLFMNFCPLCMNTLGDKE